MSWFSDLAGKAEDFLVKIDQNAAVAAQVLSAKEKSASNGIRQVAAPAVSPNEPTVSEPSAGLATGSSLNLKNSSSATDLPKMMKQSKVDRDAELMASLNQNGVANAPNGDAHLTNGNNLSLQQENQLLKQEIKSLNQEIRQAMKCAKQSEKDSKAAQSQLKAQTASLQSGEEQLSALRSENVRLADQLMDKDAELLTLKSRVEALHVEQEHNVKLEHIQQQLDKETSQRQAAENEIKMLLAEADKQKSLVQSELQLVEQQLQLTKEELSVTLQSFNEYKVRAQRILLDKDKLIQDVKQQKQKDEGVQPSEFLNAELDQLQQERDLLRVEVTQTNFQLQSLREELTSVRSKYEEEMRSLRESSVLLDGRHSDERNRREQLEVESRQLNDELRYVREDMAQQRVQAATRLHQHETELAKLRQQLANKQNSSSSPTEAELERRLRSLTETLVAKQASLEAVQSERSSLLLQLERATKLHGSENGSPMHHSSNGSDSSTRISLNITDDAKATTGVSRRVRSAYSTLDSLNFRLGQALRRRPAARGALFAYMVVLHFWVAFVLLTYSPEMHALSADHQSSENRL